MRLWQQAPSLRPWSPRRINIWHLAPAICTVLCCAVRRWAAQPARDVFSLPWPAWHRGSRQAQPNGAAPNTTEHCFTRFLPAPGDQTCRQRCYFGRRLLDQTKHSGETAGPNKCLPHTLGHLCSSPRSWYASPRLAASHGLAPVHSRGAVPGLGAAARNETRRAGGNGHRQLGGGELGDWARETGHWGKAEAGALSIAGVTLTLSPVRGLARQSQRRIQSWQARLGPLLSPAPSPARQSFAGA